MVENIFALAVVLEIKGQQPDNLPAPFNREMTGPPPIARGGRTGFLAGCEKFMARERMRIVRPFRIRARIPRFGADGRRRSI
jgi:hypothetical protein